jgi:hypothetical protein
MLNSLKYIIEDSWTQRGSKEIMFIELIDKVTERNSEAESGK